jgi:hypothetical protein
MHPRDPDDEDGLPDLWTCRIRPLGVDVAVACAECLIPALVRQLEPWGPSVSPEPASGVPVLASLSRESHGPYVFRDGTSTLATAATAEDLMVTVQHWLDAEVTRRAAGFTPVHAGVVSWAGRAILLPAPSGAGKTTLVAALLDRGAGYVSDEFAFLDVGGHVHPYPRHLIVRRPGGIERSTPPLMPSNGAGALPVGLILATRFQPGGSFHVRRIPSSEGLLLLLANTTQRIPSASAVPAAFVAAASAALSYQGGRGDVSEAAVAILRLADGLVP